MYPYGCMTAAMGICFTHFTTLLSYRYVSLFHTATRQLTRALRYFSVSIWFIAITSDLVSSCGFIAALGIFHILLCLLLHFVLCKLRHDSDVENALLWMADPLHV
jgi:hypothetical protein